MKKRNSDKLIYLFALIVNLTLFKLATQQSDTKEHAKIQVQPTYKSNGILVENLIYFEHSLPKISNSNYHTSSIKSSPYPFLEHIPIVAKRNLETPICQSNPEVLNLN